jgi:hypothetical protein
VTFRGGANGTVRVCPTCILGRGGSCRLSCHHGAGRFGAGSEYGGGLNWFIRGNVGWRLNLDATKVNSTPTEQIRTDYQAGASGTLIRAQFISAF